MYYRNPCDCHYDTACIIYLKGDKEYDHIERSNKYIREICPKCKWVVAVGKPQRVFAKPEKVKMQFKEMSKDIKKSRKAQKLNFDGLFNPKTPKIPDTSNIAVIEPLYDVVSETPHISF